MVTLVIVHRFLTHTDGEVAAYDPTALRAFRVGPGERLTVGDDEEDLAGGHSHIEMVRPRASVVCGNPRRIRSSWS